ncbi:hypothetical protein [Actinocorallia sp. A-T 12471]|uniref:hypothetical protein n=1 Tax=Actinocorallia sp. A-T 12471 TaxID=3089813 RepID=UPI0029CF22D0|nr:hypothetical protein [Actinocorallia sp. A-T 12471]MDX6738463.1 hypothetical protein [Actinocorallia sp. A-T 12471]
MMIIGGVVLGVVIVTALVTGVLVAPRSRTADLRKPHPGLRTRVERALFAPYVK